MQHKMPVLSFWFNCFICAIYSSGLINEDSLLKTCWCFVFLFSFLPITLWGPVYLRLNLASVFQAPWCRLNQLALKSRTLNEPLPCEGPWKLEPLMKSCLWWAFSPVGRGLACWPIGWTSVRGRETARDRAHLICAALASSDLGFSGGRGGAPQW